MRTKSRRKVAQVEIDIKLEGIDKVVATLNPNIYKKSLNKTLNEIGRKVKTQSTKAVRAKYNIKAKTIKDNMQVKRSRYNDLSFALHIESGRRNIIHFGARQVKKGVGVRVKKTSGRKVMKGAFIGNKGRTVFKRVKDSRLPIKAIKTLSIPQMFNKETLKEVDKEASSSFNKRFKHNFEFYISKA